MKIQWILCVGLMSAPLAPAQEAAKRVADPEQTVPRVEYRSVFAVTPTGVEESRKDWRAANDQVARFKRGHIDILKQEEAESASAKRSDAPAVRASPRATPPATPDGAKSRGLAAPVSPHPHRH